MTPPTPSVTRTDIMEAHFLVVILIYFQSNLSSAYDGNNTDLSNTTDLIGLHNFSESVESTTASLPTSTDTLPTETETSFPDYTGQSETTPENVATDLPASSTTQTASTVAPREPRQLFSFLPNPDYSVSSLCPCNQLLAECEVNCCCDPDCTDEVSLFTSCSVEKVVVNPKMCSQDVAFYSLRTNPDGFASVQSYVNQEVNSDVLCIQKANYDAGLSYATPEVPTDANFDSLFYQFVEYFFSTSKGSSSGSNQNDQRLSAGYLYGDPIQTEDDMGQRASFYLPASAGTAYCLDKNPAAFLQDQTTTCMQNFDLVNDCTTLDALSLQSYTSFQVVSGEVTLATLVPVQVVSIVLQSLEGVQTPVDPSNSSSYTPQLLNPGDDSPVCSNVVLQVQYVVVFSDVGEIKNVTTAFILGEVRSNMVPMNQIFQIEFVQESVKKPPFTFSGNPGYIVGLPLIAGTKTADGISLSADPTTALTVIRSSSSQDCLSGSMERSPVLFGIDTVSGCTLRLIDASNCSVLHEAVIGVLKGKNSPDHVASFGNSSPKNTLDWVPIKNQTTASGSKECHVPLSLHLEVRWTKHGSLVNPQAQIVSVTEIIETNTSSLVFLAGANGFVPVTTSVAFLDVSAPAEPVYRVPPTIDAKLPFDFFFPFV